MGAPQRVLLVGDLHGNWTWVAQRLLPLVDEVRPDLLLQLGDFGYFPNQPWGHKWLGLWVRELAKRDLPLWWIDGNHDDFDRLYEYPVDPATGRRPMTEHLEHLPRGHRWTWEGTTWLACGGAVSLDRFSRTINKTWWPQEALTDDDVAACVTGGPADVVVAHDLPLGAPWWRRRLQQDLPAWRRTSDWETGDLVRSDDHQRRLRTIRDAVQPRVWFHGHHHERVTDELLGTRIEGLANDGNPVGHVTLLVGPDGRELDG